MLTTSSREPDFAPVQAAFYRAVLRALNAQRVSYAVSGAFALQQHTGIWRVTKDLDVFLPAADVPAVLQYLNQNAYECEICDHVWLAKVHQGDYFVDFITGMSNAAIRVTEDWIARAQPAVVVGIGSRVLAAEELLVSKLFVARRERFDGADIAHIIYGTRGELDWNRIFELVGEHWEILLWSLVLFRYVYPAQSAYVPLPVWKELLGRLSTQVENPDPKARFRGSLVDDNMFAIDIHEWGLDDILSEYRARCTPKLDDKAA